MLLPKPGAYWTHVPSLRPLTVPRLSPGELTWPRGRGALPGAPRGIRGHCLPGSWSGWQRSSPRPSPGLRAAECALLSWWVSVNPLSLGFPTSQGAMLSGRAAVRCSHNRASQMGARLCPVVRLPRAGARALVGEGSRLLRECRGPRDGALPSKFPVWVTGGHPGSQTCSAQCQHEAFLT